ncbi:unnamed protein product [Nezara viridula]|uniref:Uncharacterized protein n=1 Tax=Nezara viridula TaxID=85310 RepID=A0A9P0MPJ1_NEZVI|nr:unnamed protein product [Nezara viridula]
MSVVFVSVFFLQNRNYKNRFYETKVLV